MKGLTKAAAFACALLLPMSACADEAANETAFADDATEELGVDEPMNDIEVADPIDDMNVDDTNVADIAADPATYEGRTVTVMADVEEVLAPRAFTLDEDDVMEGGVDEDLLVLSPMAGNLTAMDDQWLDNKVRVTGIVHSFTVVEVEDEVGWDLGADIEAEVEGRDAILIASSVERTEAQ